MQERHLVQRNWFEAVISADVDDLVVLAQISRVSISWGMHWNISSSWRTCMTYEAWFKGKLNMMFFGHSMYCQWIFEAFWDGFGKPCSNLNRREQCHLILKGAPSQGERFNESEFPYWPLIGSLLYLISHTRPDIFQSELWVGLSQIHIWYTRILQKDYSVISFRLSWRVSWLGKFICSADS